MNDNARRYAQPHFRPVQRKERLLVKNPDLTDCLVCGMPLPDMPKNTIQYFHGDCRAARVELRNQRRKP